jgi:DNA-binding MarR family transcriptional regulator
MGVAWEMRSVEGMHSIFFGLKRAWQGSLRVTRQPLAALGLTAARFDLLYLLQFAGKSSPTSQSSLRRSLGVNRTTTSRMVRSLEGLGLVTRERSYADRRTLRVSLTAQGLARIRLAIKRLIRTGAADLAVDSALAGERWHSEGACFWARAELECVLDRIRRAFRDFATLYYPWHPDD